ncbi:MULTISPECIES: YeiH family protein [unclassified Fusibacter]|uniref:YeiH family protein n=1 Tax=unclassified Fusibacter TaxID=2624464 RepID=UPI0010105FCE|nr:MULTISPECIES: YeiH family protein [unclassified Fusibacter]MCK8060165.1 YeiH family protein [Fusibacter sp. A2]NPE22305.1 YeiH family putative sulfate export transporter [Fusibacter sp. A1]RXV61078.1 YeiH family protein [Fusibacter sp. A1]
MFTRLKKYLPGLLLTLLIAIPAWILGKQVPIIGSPVLGILFGMLIAFWRRPMHYELGIKYSSKKILKYAIIFLGFNMNLFNVFKVGQTTLILMLFTMTTTLFTAFFIGKKLGLDSNTKTLIAVGTTICGGSAIAATAPIINADDEEVARAISTIFLFNVIAAFVFPLIGHLFGMSDYVFGIWAGTAVNDTSSVVAAGYSFSDEAGNLAVIVKLTRTLMIVPITLFLAVKTSKEAAKTSGDFKFASVFPWFVIGFIAASVVNTFLPVPEALTGSLVQVGKFSIVMAMVAIGLNTHLVKLIKNGWKPILLGLICWIVLASTSLIVQYSIL